MKIGSFEFTTPFIVAPMAGITDRPFRTICREMGAGYAICEMISAQEQLWNSPKSQTRMNHYGEEAPIAVQILGNDPIMMAKAAQYNVDHGADIIDINMGCPAKKVCKKAAGSSLLKDEILVESILKQVVNAVPVPVTLKIRTGWDCQHINAPKIAKIAEETGIAALSIHGRTRADGFHGTAEYDTIAKVKSCISIPVIANGDVTSLSKAREVLKITNADAIMIGRGALGNPWLFKALATNTDYVPSHTEFSEILMKHLHLLYEFYGEFKGVRFARKHLLWYLERLIGKGPWRASLLSTQTKSEQIRFVSDLLQHFKSAA